jgi:MFS family permease
LASAKSAIEREVERNYRHNFVVNVLDGTFFWGGSSLIATTTILPVYVRRLSDSDLLIGLLSMISSMGWLLPQLFTANWVQRLPRKKVLPVNLGLFTERLPVLLLALSSLLAVGHPTLALAAFFVFLAWHVVGAGVVAVAWQDMIGKIIPAKRRGKFFGLTNFLGTGTGVAGAWAAAWVLDRYGFPGGYTWCFGVAAAMLALSWICLALTREPAQEPQSAPVSQLEFWRGLPSVLRGDPNFGRYLISQVILALGGMAGGFYTVYAVQRWQLSDGQAGNYQASMLIGQALSNLIFGPLADRRGHKLVLELSVLLGALGIGLAVVAPGPAWFYLVFALFGARLAGILLSGLMIALEFCEEHQRPTYIGLNNTVRGMSYGVAPLVGGWLAGAAGYQVLFAVALGITGVGLAVLHWSVQEPREGQVMAQQTEPGV